MSQLEPRIVSHFSCGAASAVATKLILSEYPAERVRIMNAFLVEEHKDNQRFLVDCRRWFNHPIEQFVSEEYLGSAREVWRRKRFLANGMYGAPCSVELKRKILDAECSPTDIFVLGYTKEEEDRVERFMAANNGRKVLTPLIDRGLGKADCLAIIERIPIALPAMYLLGFNNNNCIACCKGGEGYWDKTRTVFPKDFIEVAEIQKAIGPGAYIFRDRHTGERFSLYDLPEGAGRHDEPAIECSIFCMMAEQEVKPVEASQQEIS